MDDLYNGRSDVSLYTAVRLVCPVVIDVITTRVRRSTIYGNARLQAEWQHAGFDPRALDAFMLGAHRTCETRGVAASTCLSELYEYQDVYKIPMLLVQLPVSAMPNDSRVNLRDYDFSSEGGDNVMRLLYTLYQTIQDHGDINEYVYGRASPGGAPALADAADRIAALEADMERLRADNARLSAELQFSVAQAEALSGRVDQLNRVIDGIRQNNQPHAGGNHPP
jgi:FtsZ-binding cell division protein ZapB